MYTIRITRIMHVVSKLAAQVYIKKIKLEIKITDFIGILLLLLILVVILSTIIVKSVLLYLNA